MDGSVVSRAIEAGGGLLPLAAKLGVRYQALQKWRKSGRVPAERVLALEAASGISRHELRPDLYPRDSSRVRSSPRGPTTRKFGT